MKIDWEKVVWKTPCGKCGKRKLNKISRTKAIGAERHVEAVCSSCEEGQIVKYGEIAVQLLYMGQMP